MKNIDAYETDAVVDGTASVRITELPFPEGQRVRVLIMGEERSGSRRHTKEELQRSKEIRELLKGSVLSDDFPFEPAVPPEDWDAISGSGLV
ncbi:MAG TPA: hypothetical protein VFE47_10195 [Tepidisphaeraceae bacterium]|jgi:hypothetical protein|nr:hypothetical protein [Tepidisphaeraceae bacterium]